MDIFIDFANFLVEMIGEGLAWLVDLLPDSPVQAWENEKPDKINLGHVTWFIPFPTMLLHFTVFLSALLFYYGYRIVARWLKVVRG